MWLPVLDAQFEVCFIIIFTFFPLTLTCIQEVRPEI